MTINQLTYLIAVVQEGINLSRASRKLGVSQPNISKQLALLEDEVAAPLFERAGRRLHALTPAGRQLFRHAVNVTRELEQLQKDVSPEAMARSAIIGATAATTRHVLPHMLAAAGPQLGDLAVEVETLSGSDIAEAVLQGRCDIGLISGPAPQDPGLALLPWYRWRYRVLCRRGSPITAEIVRNPGVLHEHPIIACASLSAPRPAVLRALDRLGISQRIDRITPDPDEVKEVVRTNGHIGLIAEMAYSEETDADLEALEAPAPFPTLMAWIAMRRNTALRPGVSRLVGGIASHLRPELIETFRREPVIGDPRAVAASVRIPRYG